MGFFERVGILQQSLQKFAGGDAYVTQQQQIVARKAAFGVACFDLLRATSTKSRMKMFLHQVDPSGAEAFLKCQQDVAELEGESAHTLDKLTALVVDGRTRGGESGAWWLEKLEGQVAELDQRIRARKEQFGVAFFDAIPTGQNGSPQRMQVHKARGRALQDCIEEATHAVWVMENHQQLQAQGRLAEC